ncbi:hypothetical protein WISP_119107 [Willisornis vidua]|uniref:Uncharacterized protein n=1 Tax=Willisornis vidua TaxID=1566151 RepID=A0ABQ9CZA7_9PASS|nr:hypothetical protein WISP_119107 [Willisornis vidua]
MIKDLESLALHGLLEIRAPRKQSVQKLALADRRDHMDFSYVEEQQMFSTTSPSLWAAPLIESVGLACASRGFLACASVTFSVELPPANNLKHRLQLDAQSEPVNCPFLSLRPKETGLSVERMAEVAVKLHRYSALRATCSSLGRGNLLALD